MTTIEEIPLDIPEVVEEAPPARREAPNQETVEDIQEKVETPKKRGRPAGAKNKKKIEPIVEVKPVPKAIPKAKAVPKAIPKAKAIPVKAKVKRVVEEYSSSEEEAVAIPRAPEIDRRALAAEMIEMLSQQRHGRANARRDHYASWFQ